MTFKFEYLKICVCVNVSTAAVSRHRLGQSATATAAAPLPGHHHRAGHSTCMSDVTSGRWSYHDVTDLERTPSRAGPAQIGRPPPASDHRRGWVVPRLVTMVPRWFHAQYRRPFRE